MSESILFKLMVGLLGTLWTLVTGFFWFTLNGLKDSNEKAHERITEQERHNADTYARRPDVDRVLTAVSRLDDRIVELMKEGKK